MNTKINKNICPIEKVFYFFKVKNTTHKIDLQNFMTQNFYFLT